jgi:hypothetical protein
VVFLYYEWIVTMYLWNICQDLVIVLNFMESVSLERIHSHM